MRRPITHTGALIRGLVVAGVAVAVSCLTPRSAAAQEVPYIPATATEPKGLVAEPEIITRAALFVDRQLSKGESSNGFYWDFTQMVPGAGWISGGPGYRHWYKGDKLLVDGSGAISWHQFKAAQGRIELPALAHSRLALGTQARWFDYGQVDYFGMGPASEEVDRTQYRLQSKNVAGYATLRPARWMEIDAEIGWLKPSLGAPSGLFRRDLPSTLDVFAGSPVHARFDTPTFIPKQVSVTADTRDFPAHPSRGVLLRGSAAHYDDRDSGVFTFKRYESEAAGFVPFGGGRLVVALHGWAVATETGFDQLVPFYLQPSLGGSSTLRGYGAYRFHDNNMLVVNAEARIALLTHVDFALFADAGNVAAEWRDLDIAKRSYGAGLRLHTRRITFARLDAARGDEGWRLMFRLTDPLDLSRLARRAAIAPFVP